MNNMKRLYLLPILALCLAACQQLPSNEIVNPLEAEEVSVTFAPVRVPQEAMDEQSIADICTSLDVWFICEGETIDVHQASTDAGFGTVSLSLNKTKTYTMYAVAHKATGAATLADNIISFPDDKVTHTLYATSTFSPASTTTINAEMQRIVAQFRFTTTDAVPDDVTKMRFTLGSVFDRWNVTTGGTHQLDRVVTFENFSKNQDGTATFVVYVIVTNVETQHDVMVEALGTNDAVIESRTFEDVSLRNGYKTSYSGTFFVTTPMQISFSVADWNAFDTVNF